MKATGRVAGAVDDKLSTDKEPLSVEGRYGVVVRRV